jgi:site-specific recombinase XerD
MARQTKFSPVETTAGWRLNIPAKYTETGKRERHFYRTQREAQVAAKLLKQSAAEFGHQSQAIRPSLAEDATAAAALLEPWGLSLLEAARIVAGIRTKETASRPLSAAADEWLVACEGLRTKTLQGYKHTANRLKAALADRILATITAEELQKAIAPAGTPATAAAGHLRTAKALWRWCAGKGWCDAKTFDGVKLPKSSAEAGEIEILAPDEALELLRTAEEHFPQAVASFALQLFAGIRAEEITRMESRHVTSDGIELGAAVTKKGRRRHITPSTTLAAWLAMYPFEPCPNWRETSAACRRLAGWDVSAVILNERVRVGTMEPLPEPSRGRWPQNALRHSHASYAVASGVPLESLLFEFGHAGNPTLLRQHYVGRASKKQALAFFAIVPEGVEAPAAIQPVEMTA